WMFPSNWAAFDVLTAFAALHKIDWRRNCTAREGDIVFIYLGEPMRKIVIKAVIVKDDVRRADIIPDEKFSKLSTANYDERLADTSQLLRLKPIASYVHLEDELQLETLRSHGLAKNIQGPQLLENNDELR